MTQPTLKELFDWIEDGPHCLSHFEISRRKWAVIDWHRRDWPITLLEQEQMSYQQLLDLAQLTLCSMYGRWKQECTPRQAEQTRLWQQRGLLERTRANLRSVLSDKTLKFNSVTDKGFLNAADSIISEQILINSNEMKTISQRISE